MLELNTDRMLFGIGAIIIGAGLILWAVAGFPGMMSIWGFTMADSVNHVEVASGSEMTLVNGDFKAFSQGWGQSGTSGNIVFDGHTAYIPQNERIFTELRIPTNSEVRVSFKARGYGKVKLEIGGAETISTSSEMTISSMDDFHTYRATLRKLNDSDTHLVFSVPAGSEVILDEVSVTYMGLIE